jgi:FkbM family methyltransferase
VSVNISRPIPVKGSGAVQPPPSARATMKTIVRTMLARVLRLLPAGTPERIYAALFRGILGTLVNPVITALLPKEIHIPEGVVALNPNDPAVSGATAFGVYEPYETALFRETVQPGMTVVDIGANIGYYTVIAAGRAGPMGRVIAFEPAPDNYATLQRTIHVNGFENVDTYAVAIADKKGTLALNLFASNGGKHSLVKDARDSKGFSTSIQVATSSLDNFLGEHGIGHVDIIKMDIEGAESLALMGMQEALGQASTLFLEFTPASITKARHDPSTVLLQLRECGFTLYEIDERTQSTKLISNDAYFVHAIPHAECANLFCVR